VFGRVDPVRRLPKLFLPAAALLAVALTLCGIRGGGSTRTPYHGAFGRGSTVVLVHGLGSSPKHWLPTARILAKHHHVILVELPGHGDSEMSDLFSLDQTSEALDRVIANDSREPVTLVGHSIGGLVAADEALRHPERVRQLVLVETALRPQVQGPEREGMLDALEFNYLELLRAAFFSFGRDSVQGAELYHEVAALDSTSIKQWIRLALLTDLSPDVGRLAMPTLAVLAERSWPVGEPWKETARVLGYSLIPHLQTARIAGCGHFVMLDRPAELAETIERFIAQPYGEPIAAK